MNEKPVKGPKPKHVIRTKTPGYFFGSGKAADAQQKRRGTTRLPSKLPTSLDDLQALKVKT
jgi:hypothetical protein